MDIIIYSDNTGNIKVDLYYENDSFWIKQKRMAELFNVEVNTINYHLKEIFASGELDTESTIRKIQIVQKEGTINFENIILLLNKIN